MRPISIPPALRARPLNTVGLSQRVLNRLLLAGVRTLGGLDGMTFGQIGTMPGVGAAMLTEINEFLQRLPGLAEQLELNDESSDEGVRDASILTLSPIIDVPPEFRPWRLASIGLPEQTSAALRRVKKFTLEDINGLTEAQIQGVAGVGSKGVRALTDAIAALSSLPDLSCLVVDEAGAVPANAPPALLLALARARFADDEVSALLTGLGHRNAEMIRARWTRRRGRIVKLDDIAARYAITRERVRQITDKRDELLKATSLRLPHFSRIVSLVEQAGGAMSPHELARRIVADGIASDSSVLEVIESFSGLGLVAQLTYSDRYKLWLTERGSVELERSGRLDEATKSLRERVRRELSAVGAIHLETIGGLARFGIRHALGVALKRELRFERVGDYVVPRPAAKSDLLRGIYQMLSVTPAIRLEDILAGLRSMRIRRRDGDRRLRVPPTPVVERIIANCESLEMRDGIVSVVGTVPDATLSPSDRVLIAAIERCGGLARWDEIIEGVQQAGFSLATAQVLLQRPFVVRVATALYGLRGRDVPHDVLRARLRERQRLRRGCIKSVSYPGGPVGKVVYEMTTFAIQGVLPVPTKLGRLAHTRWRARFPDGHEAVLKTRAHFLWPLKKWFDAERVCVGDLVMATFYIAEARIEFDLLS